MRRRSLTVPIKGIAVSADFLILGPQAVTRAGRILLDDVCPEVEELLQREQVLIGLLAPLAEADEHEILLQGPLLFRKRMEARVLDGDRRLKRKALRPLHLFGGEAAAALTLRQDHGTDGVTIRNGRHGPEGT